MLRRILTYIRYLWQLTEGFHRVVTLRTLLGVGRVGVMLLFIWLSKTVIDFATGKTPASTSTLIWLFIAIIVCLLTDMVITQCVRYMESRATTQMNNRIDRRLYNVLMALPLVNGQQGFHSGDMLNRLTLDVRTISSFTLSQLPSMVVMLVQLLGSFIFLACLNPYLALAPIVIMPLCLIASKLYFRRQRRLTAAIRREESEMNVSIQEGLKHRMLLKSLECIEELDLRLGKILQRLDGAGKEQARLSRLSGAMVRLGFLIGYLTAFGWSIFSLKAGIISFGTMTAFIQLVSRIQSPIASLTGYIPAFISASVAIDRLREIDLPLPLSKPRGESRPLKNAGVRVSGLSFRYDSDVSDVISSFSHDFLPGSRTMIIGSTGAGKTTLIKLLLGLLTPSSGSIEIYSGEGDNEETINVSSSTICNFVYVPQGNSLLHGTIRENLLLAAPQASEEQLADVLHTAAADFVFDLPMGLDTSCDEAGGGLSEGQAQRIAIARALLRPGSIILLDEFNSALDSTTASTLMRRLADRCADSTIIIIAHHRTAIAPYCDTILPITSPYTNPQSGLHNR